MYLLRINAIIYIVFAGLLMWGINNMQSSEDFKVLMHFILLTYPAFVNYFEFEVQHKNIYAKIFDSKVFAIENQQIN